MGQDEIERQFEVHNLDRDMQEAHKKASRVISRREAARISNGHAVAAVILVLLIGVLLFLFGAF